MDSYKLGDVFIRKCVSCDNTMDIRKMLGSGWRMVANGPFMYVCSESCEHLANEELDRLNKIRKNIINNYGKGKS